MRKEEVENMENVSHEKVGVGRKRHTITSADGADDGEEAIFPLFDAEDDKESEDGSSSQAGGKEFAKKSAEDNLKSSLKNHHDGSSSQAGRKEFAEDENDLKLSLQNRQQRTERGEVQDIERGFVKIEHIESSQWGLHWIGTRAFFSTYGDMLKTGIVVLLVAIGAYDFFKGKKDFMVFPLVIVLIMIIMSFVSTLLDALVHFYSDGIKFLTAKGILLTFDMIASCLHLITGVSSLMYAILRKELPGWLDLCLILSAVLSAICIIAKYCMKYWSTTNPQRTFHGEIRRINRMLNDTISATNEIGESIGQVEEKFRKRATELGQGIQMISAVNKESIMVNERVAKMKALVTAAPSSSAPSSSAPGNRMLNDTISATNEIGESIGQVEEKFRKRATELGQGIQMISAVNKESIMANEGVAKMKALVTAAPSSSAPSSSARQ